MNKQTEALKMAIEALEYILNTKQSIFDADKSELLCVRAIKNCKEALEQPAQESVGDAHYYYSTIERCLDDLPDEYLKLHRNFLKDVAMTIRNTHPAPSWQGLSELEVLKLLDKSKLTHNYRTAIIEFYRDIESELKRKNNE